MRPYVVIIPAYHPMRKLIHYIEDLLQENVQQVIVINDGNELEYKVLFEEIDKLDRTIVLHHELNQGKGAGLKTAFSYLAEQNSPFLKGAITADADGQHLVKDVVKLMDELDQGIFDFVLGIRDFSNDHVPLRSKIGNYLASLVFKWLFGYYLQDTQTGLRGIKNSEFIACSKISGEGFDYEINMLIYMARQQKNVREVVISTVYHDDHFSNYRTIVDSLAIGRALLKGYFLDERKET